MHRKIGIIAALASQLSATTYYVSSSGGSDTNNGTSTATPIKTINKVNSLPLAAGDSVLFKAGDTWTGANFSSTLSVPASGVSGSVITFSSYGSGVDPLLDGAGTIGTLFNAGNHSYIMVSHIQGANTTTWGLIGSGSNIVIDHTSYSSAVIVGWAYQWKSTSGLIKVTYTNNACTLTNPSSDPGCFDVEGNTADSLMQYNKASGGSQSYSFKPVANSCAGPAVTGGSILDNESDSVTTAKGGDGQNIELEGCSSYPETGVTVARNVLLSNSSTDAAIAGYYAGSNYLYGNVIVGPSSNSCFHFSSSSPNNRFYNNTVSGCTLGFAIYNSGSTGNIIQNNIMANLSTGGISVDTAGGASATEDYNDYYNCGVNNAGATAGGHSITSNPLFVTSNPSTINGAKLQSISPAIGVGFALGPPYNSILSSSGTALPYGIFTQSGLYSIGAFGVNTTLPMSLGIVGLSVRGLTVP